MFCLDNPANLDHVIIIRTRKREGKVIGVGVHIYVYMFMDKKKILNRTLAIDLPFLLSKLMIFLFNAHLDLFLKMQ